MAPHVPEVLALWREATVGEKHVHRTDDDNIIIKPTLGTSRSYTLSRLKREAFKNSGTKKNRASMSKATSRLAHGRSVS
jgi:hypothetical protein